MRIRAAPVGAWDSMENLIGSVLLSILSMITSIAGLPELECK